MNMMYQKINRFQGAQHQAMAQHYRQTIIQTLKEFDNNSHTDQFYNALAWNGLMGEGNFNATTGLPTNPTVAWQNIPQNDRIQIITTSNNFNTTNKPCQ
jgi:hypothetical protein